MPGGDLSFEKKFGQLAYAQVAEKVPSLISHYKGFQLLDKNDEDTEAAGVAAFLVNDLFMYIPVFFLSGDLKGTDLLYVYQRDMFVPSTDNWVVSLKKYGLNSLGESVSASDPGQISYTEPGGITLDSMNMENIRKMASRAVEKVASDANTLISADAVTKMFAAMETEVRWPTLSSSIPAMGKTAASAFLRTFANNMDFANALLHVYTPKELEKIAEETTKSMTDVLDGPDAEKVTVISSIDDEEVEDLNAQEKRLLIRNGTYVVDHRANPSKVYRDRIDSDTLSTPRSSGLYSVLLSDGSFKTLSIIRVKRTLTRLSNTDRDISRDGGTSLIVMDPSSPKDAYCVDGRNVHAQVEDPSTTSQMESLDKLPTANRMELEKATDKLQKWHKQDYDKRPDKSPVRSYAMLCGKDDAVLIGLKGYTCCEGNDQTLQVELEQPVWGGSSYASPVTALENDFTVHIAKNKQVETVGDVLMVPETARMMPVSKDCPWEFGRPETLVRLADKAEKEGSLATLQLHAKGGTYSIVTTAGTTGTLSKVAALKTLVLYHGIGAGDAQCIMKEAASDRKGVKQYMVQHAPNYKQASVATGYSQYGEPTFGNESSSDKKPSIAHREQEAEDISTTTRRERGNYGHSEGMLGEDGIEQAVAASKAGIKEVFDTTVLQQMLDVADIAELRTDYVSDLLKATDSIGRLLFLFYWHRESFEDKYGTSEVSKLENTLRNVFSSVGDLTLFLREKTSEHSVFGGEPTEDNMSSEIGTAAEGMKE